MIERLIKNYKLKNNIAISFVLLVLISSLVTSYINYKHNKQILYKNIDKQLLTSAYTMKLLLDDNFFDKAIQNSKIISYFQPIINNKTKQIEKYESLVRLIDEDNKILSPYFFLDTAKKSNYYTKITNLVIEQSFDILQKLNISISINLSALDIEQRKIKYKILNLLKQNSSLSHKITFELLEDETIKDFHKIKNFITEVKKYEATIAIDDFGDCKQYLLKLKIYFKDNALITKKPIPKIAVI